MRLLDERHLAGEEVPEVHELRIVGQELRRRRLERKPDADPERVGRARALDAGLHDSRPGAGDHHPLGLGQPSGEAHGLVVQRVVALGARGSEDRRLACRAVRLEHRERVAHLLERGVRHLEIAARHVVTCEAHRRNHQLEEQIRVAHVVAQLRDQLGQLRVDLGITRAIARKREACGRQA